jgi:hypothetical protein
MRNIMVPSRRFAVFFPGEPRFFPEKIGFSRRAGAGRAPAGRPLD